MENGRGSEKTVEELAREAMQAIKQVERINEDREREEMKAAEQALKDDVENRVKRKLRILEKEQELNDSKTQKVDTTFMVHWSNLDKKGFRYEGNYNDKFTFRINKGITLYHLYVEDKTLIYESWHHKSHTSTDLYTLKEKADKLLKEFLKKAENKKQLPK